METENLSSENQNIRGLLSANGIDPKSNPSPPPALGTSNKDKQKQRSPPIIEPSSGERNASEVADDEDTDPRVYKCRTLLLQDIEAYRSVTPAHLLVVDGKAASSQCCRSDEEEEKLAWDSFAKDILSNMQKHSATAVETNS